MQNATCLVAGRSGTLIEVEQIDLFQCQIADQEYTFAVHPEPLNPRADVPRKLVVSLFESGCKITDLCSPRDTVIFYDKGLKPCELRPLAEASIRKVVEEIGEDRLAKLIANSVQEFQRSTEPAWMISRPGR